jgi:hypothetical protein
VTKPMPDEYYQRYKTLTHRELYDKLMAGSPTQINGMVTTWKSMESSANSLADTLRRDLERLLPNWDSAAGREFQRRLGLIVSFADALAGEFNSLHTGLSTMSSTLADAKKKAEDPQNTDDMDKTVSGAAKGAAVGSLLGPVGTVGGGIVGGLMGHNQDEEEKQKARERMVVLVATLAAEYGVTDHGQWPGTVVNPPVDLPDGAPNDSVSPNAAPHSSAPHQVPSTGVSDRNTTNLATTPTQSGPLPSTGDGSGVGTGNGGSTGADHLVGTGTALQSTGAGLTGAGSGTPSGLLGAGSGLVPGSSGTTLSSGALGVSGLAGAAGVGAGLGGSGGDGRSATGGSRSAAGAGRSAAGSGSGEGDEPDEHLTWLTEDDMVWGDDSAPPGVLGTTATVHEPGAPITTDEPQSEQSP